jgi:hypothetical protein
MVDKEVFNSSNLEFKSLPEQGDHYSLKSIKAILQSTFEDYVASKKASKLLTNNVDSPMS